jgi:hypothetical protein
MLCYAMLCSPPWAQVARNYVAQTMNAAFNSTTAAQDNVIAVSAMEAVGLGRELQCKS